MKLIFHSEPNKHFNNIQEIKQYNMTTIKITLHWNDEITKI